MPVDPLQNNVIKQMRETYISYSFAYMYRHFFRIKMVLQDINKMFLLPNSLLIFYEKVMNL